MQASLFIVGVLVGGFLIGNLARLVIPWEQRLTWSETTLAGTAGAAVGAFITNFVRSNTGTTAFGWGTLLGAFAGTLLVLGVVSVVMNRFGLRPDAAGLPTTGALISAGENHQVEFKSTARWNVHTEQRDSRIELVIAKTITDYLEHCLGKPAVANVTVTFELVSNSQICRADVEASPTPVFLDEPGGNREADMYVRMGNSTRKLLTDEALDYSKQHW